MERIKEVDFILRFGQLKRHVRTGWLSKGLSPAQVESIADHVSRTILIAMLLAEKFVKSRVNLEAVLRMALFHDVVEIVLKDIDKEAWSQLSPDGKLKAIVENRIVRNLFASFPPAQMKKYVQEWTNYREKKTLESRIVVAADKLELAFQAYEYACQGVSKSGLSQMINDASEEIERLGLPQASQFLSEISSRFNKNKL